jgi:dihydropteroate synthase
MAGIYLQPVGLFYAEVARDAVALGGALPLAGSSMAFGAVRLWEGEAGHVRHTILRTPEILAVQEPRVRALLERIAAPRAHIAGLDMNGPKIMGVVNVTPDSFSDGGDSARSADAIALARRLEAEGASIIDIGAESTRPGAQPLENAAELARLLPVLRGLADLKAPVSVDTRKPDVMRQAVRAGAAIINDVSGLTYSSDSLAAATELGKPVILMHAQGEPATMQDNPVYKDAVIEVYDYLESRIEAAGNAGISRDRIVADPGIGFGKTLSHNLSILRNVGIFHGLGVPLLTGTSRKGFIGKITGAAAPKDRLAGSLASAADAISQGVQIVRVHDVKATREALAVWQALYGSPNAATRNA